MRIEVIAKIPQAFVHDCKRCNFTQLIGTEDFRRIQFETYPLEVRQNMEHTQEILAQIEQDFQKGTIEVHIKNPLDLRVGWQLRKLKEKDPLVLINGQVAFRGEIPDYMELKKHLQSISTP